MNIKEQLTLLLSNFNTLDMRKKIGMIVTLILIVVSILLFSSYMNRATSAPLYTNLTLPELTKMSKVLAENRIKFEVSSDNKTISVKPGQVSKARFILAEVGLPASSESGYELFDKVNTLGLTSFMQDITNKRAIQGELARTVQMIAGVKSARVHLVTPNKSVFKRHNQNKTTASLIIKTSGTLRSKTVIAIRHMVAAAIPGLESNQVTIVNADGTLLTTNENSSAAGTTHLIEMESNYENAAESKVVTALGAHLGISNFRVTISAKLNADKKRIEESVFDPDSRVERSIKINRETDTSENKASSNPVSVTQNLPDETKEASSGQTSSENKDRRQETTNYEINSKKTSSVSDGYKVENLSVSLVVNKSRIADLLGNNPDQSKIDDKIKELEKIVQSTLGISSKRGDQINISFVEFLPESIIGSVPETSSFMRLVNLYTGQLINAIGIIIGAVILSLLGVRPLLAFLSQDKNEEFPEDQMQLAGQNAGQQAATQNRLETPATEQQFEPGDSPQSNYAGIDLDEISEREEGLKNQLETMISQNDERVALVVKQWLNLDQSPST